MVSLIVVSCCGTCVFTGPQRAQARAVGVLLLHGRRARQGQGRARRRRGGDPNRQGLGRQVEEDERQAEGAVPVEGRQGQEALRQGDGQVQQVQVSDKKAAAF